VKVESVDERTTSWEQDFPTYRVYFWDVTTMPGSLFSVYTYELTEAHNVQQVLAWADANARGRIYQVFVITGEEGHRGLLHLCGTTPTNPSDPRYEPPPELQADDEMKGAAHLAETRKRREERALAEFKARLDAKAGGGDGEDTEQRKTESTETDG
jgi:hypothetical protein